MTEYEQGRTIRETAMMILGTIIICAILGSMTYCSTAPSYPRPVDQEAEAVRVNELKLAQACAATGGAWMPIYRSGYNTTHGCVNEKNINVVQEWAKPK